MNKKRGAKCGTTGETLFSETQKIGKIGGWEWDIKTNKVCWTKGVALLFGMKDGEFGETYAAYKKLIHPDDLSHHKKCIKNALDKKELYDSEYRIVSPNGIVYWTRNAGKVIRNKKGKPVKMIGIVQDITKWKQVESALKEKEAQYRDLFDNANDLIQSIDSSGHIIYVNKKWLKTMGYTRKEAMKLKITDFVHPNELSHCVSIFKKLSEGKEFETVKTTFIAKDGREIYVEGNLNSNTKNDEFKSTRGIFRDISKRKRIEIDLVESEARYRDIVENSPLMIHSVDRDGHIVFVNKKECELLGYSSKKMVGMHIKNIYDSSTWKKVVAGFKTLQNKGALFVSDAKMVKKNGEIIDVEIDSIGVYDDEGKFVRTRSMIRDITKHKKIEAKLKESETNYRDIVENSPNMIHSVDAKGYIVFVNDKEAEVLGYTKDELIGMYMCKLYGNQVCDRVKAGFDRLKKEGTMVIPDGALYKKNGEKLTGEIHSIAIYDDEGNFVRTRSIIHDITERRKIEDELKQKIRQMELMAKLNLKRHKEMMKLEQELKKLKAQQK